MLADINFEEQGQRKETARQSLRIGNTSFEGMLVK